MPNLPAVAICAATAALAYLIGFWQPAAAQGASGSHAQAHTPIEAPPGFREACRRYEWLCRAGASARRNYSDEQLLDHARSVNAHVNRTIVQVDDSVNYGVAEYWTLPYNGRGDCEDLALLKKKMLVERGVDPRRLLMAVVLDRRGENHALLLLRLNGGDVVLDSLTDRIRPWSQSGYTFLAKQQAANKSQWGVLLHRSVATR